jgi:hypothetical protein
VLSATRDVISLWINGARDGITEWNDEWATWPPDTSVTASHHGARVSPGDGFYTVRSFQDIVMDGWQYTDSSPVHSSALLDAVCVSSLTDASRRRILRSSELEALYDIPSEWSNSFPKASGVAGKPEQLQQRERRRKKYIISSVPFGVAAFAVASALGPAVCTATEMWSPPTQVGHTFARARDACPFITEMVRCGRGASEAFSPDHAELYGHSSAFLTEKLQTKKVAGKNSPITCVPSGLEPTEHFEQGLVCKSPLDVQSPISCD